MKISRIEFENFRNFRNHGEIKCSTDGKVTIIYGKNGDGKTTLHQLLQWIFYGKVNFNKTTTDRLFNLHFEHDCSYGQTFNVMGCVDFEHSNTLYSLKRVYGYRKDLNDSVLISEDVVLQHRDEDYNWKRVVNPNEIVEKVLPSGLADHFFFDGESMIADLRVKGKDSANKLRKALYSMFNLDIIQSAINHIGRTDAKTTVLGKLYLSKGAIASDSQIASKKAEIDSYQDSISKISREKDNRDAENKKLQKEVDDASEKIGGYRTTQAYEKMRKQFIEQRDCCLSRIKDQKSIFGDAVFEVFPMLLTAKTAINARKRINLRIDSQKLPSGITRDFLLHLLSDENEECVCGHKLGETEKRQIRSFLDMLPPKSYSSLYQNFKERAGILAQEYNSNRFETCIKDVLENKSKAENFDQQISELDSEKRNIPKLIENLIIDRQIKSKKIEENNSKINQLNVDLKIANARLKKCMDEYDKLTEGNEVANKALIKISIMQDVAKYFQKILNEKSKVYSERLQDNIQILLEKMLTSKRRVSVSTEFSVQVTDSFQDESKSEGQFAVVSFAYIGGILQMLQKELEVFNREYPLVLDGPFSKLDPDQRKNVIDVIPKIAPQVILFSKDNLHEVFDSDKVGHVWRIESNDEKNLAEIKEGYLKEYF